MRQLYKALAIATLLASFALPSRAQDLGSVNLGTVQQKVFTGQTTATVSPNSVTSFPCVPTNGSPCTIPNKSQSSHTLFYSAPSCSAIDIRLEGSFDGTTFFSISQDALDTAPNPVGGLTGVGAVTAIGYYPVVRANLVSIAGGGCAVTAFYSGTAATPPSSAAVAQQASPYRVPVTVGTVTSAAFNTIEIPTPFGSSGGSLWLQCSAACAGGGAFSVFASPTDSGLGSLQITSAAIATVSTPQHFDIPALNTNRIFVGLTPTGASANTWTVVYQFAPQGNGPFTKSGLTFGNTGSPAIVTCENFQTINTTASLLLLAGSAGKLFYICSFEIVVGAADNVALVEGTGAVCVTGTTGVFGGNTAATGWNLAANGQVSIGSGLGFIGKTATNGNSLCLLVSAAAQVSGGFSWTQLTNP